MEFMLITVILSCDFYNFRDPYARIIIKPCLIVTVMYTIIKQRPADFGSILRWQAAKYRNAKLQLVVNASIVR